MLIIASEVGFWILLALGLVLRYLLRMPRSGAVVLALIPLIDVVLLGAVAFDLHSGAEVSRVHQLAGLYLGVSVAFGPSIVRWGDVWAAYWTGHGPKPLKAPSRGPAALKHEMRSFVRWLLAAIITSAVVGLLALTVADEEQLAGLLIVFPALGIVTALWLLSGPLWVIAKVTAPDETPAERARS